MTAPYVAIGRLTDIIVTRERTIFMLLDALDQIATVCESSTTANSLPYLARRARAAIANTPGPSPFHAVKP